MPVIYIIGILSGSKMLKLSIAIFIGYIALVVYRVEHREEGMPNQASNGFHSAVVPATDGRVIDKQLPM